MKPRLLDLYAGAGGAGVGYARAGFDVTGIDTKKRTCGYPAGHFIRADALDALTDTAYLQTFDLIHASPPCQTHSRTKHLRNAQGNKARTPDLIFETRARLMAAGIPYVMENVPGAPMRADVTLCGSMFDLTADGRQLRRHRIFETNLELPAPPPCRHEGRPLGVYGSKGDDIPSGGQTCSTLVQARELMGIPWMNWAAIIEAIPPAYTEWIGRHALSAVRGVPT